MVTVHFTTSRGVPYNMSLCADENGHYHVSINSTLRGMNHGEEHVFKTYDEACRKFQSVYRWNEGKTIVLPTEERFLGVPEGTLYPNATSHTKEAANEARS